MSYLHAIKNRSRLHGYSVVICQFNNHYESCIKFLIITLSLCRLPSLLTIKQATTYVGFIFINIDFLNVSQWHHRLILEYLTCVVL